MAATLPLTVKPRLARSKKKTPSALLARAVALHRQERSEALEASVIALAAAQRYGESNDVALALECHLAALLHCGRLSSALECVPDAIQACRLAKNPILESSVRAQHVEILADLGLDRQALEEGLAARSLAEATGNARALCQTLLALGFLYRGLDQIDTAKGFFQQVVDISKASGESYLLARATNNLGNCFNDVSATSAECGEIVLAHQQLRTALQFYSAAESMAAELGEHRLQRTARRNVGLCWSDLGDHEKALALYAEELERARMLKSPSSEEMSLRLIGRARFKQKRFAQAIEVTLQAAEIARASGRAEREMQSQSLLADAFEALSDYENALGHLRKYQRLREKVISESADRRARALAAQFSTEEAKASAAVANDKVKLLESSNAELANKALDLYKASHEDALTGLFNRRRLEAFAVSDLSMRDGLRPYSVCMIDVDHFKRVNDNFSHAVGDKVLQTIGSILRACCRHHDFPVRYGGEEFAVVFVPAGIVEAQVVSERIRSAIEAHSWSLVHPGLAITVSIGVAGGTERVGLDDLFALADARLYVAKRSGRNRVVVSDK